MRWFFRLPLFWQIQLSGWLVYTIATFPLKVYAFQTYEAALIVSVYREPFGLLLSTGLREIYRRIDRQRISWLRISALVCFAALVCGAVDTWLGGLLMSSFGLKPGAEGAPVTMGIFCFRAILYVAWSLLYFWIKAWHEARERELRVSRAETRQREAELQMLRAQINPHFLFNALNTVIAGLNREQAVLQSVVQGLADYLRYALAHRNADRVPLGEEFDAIVHYLTVEKARFGADLQIDTTIEPGLRETLVPGILLQPLVENALKHGWQSAESPLQLRLQVRRDNTRGVQIEVANTGAWIDPQSGSRNGVGGAGLENIRRRLELLYPGRHTFEVGAREGWVVACISLAETNGAPPHP